MSGRGAVVLFDIDGTLIRRAGPHHRLALISAIRETTGLETSFSGIDTSGRLDRDLIRIMLETAGADEESIQQCMTETVKLAQRIYTSSTVDLRRKVCPGVRVALRRLQVARIPMGLVTGNLTAIGWRKMEAARPDEILSVWCVRQSRPTRGLSWSPSRFGMLGELARRDTPCQSCWRSPERYSRC